VNTLAGNGWIATENGQALENNVAPLAPLWGFADVRRCSQGSAANSAASALGYELLPLRGRNRSRIPRRSGANVGQVCPTYSL